MPYYGNSQNFSAPLTSKGFFLTTHPYKNLTILLGDNNTHCTRFLRGLNMTVWVKPQHSACHLQSIRHWCVSLCGEPPVYLDAYSGLQPLCPVPPFCALSLSLSLRGLWCSLQRILIPFPLQILNPNYSDLDYYSDSNYWYQLNCRQSLNPRLQWASHFSGLNWINLALLRQSQRQPQLLLPPCLPQRASHVEMRRMQIAYRSEEGATEIFRKVSVAETNTTASLPQFP